MEVVPADLVDGAWLDTVPRRLRSDSPIDILANNVGAALLGDFATADPRQMDKLLRLDVVVATMLASAAVGGMVARGSGAIVVGPCPRHLQKLLPTQAGASRTYETLEAGGRGCRSQEDAAGHRVRAAC